MRRPLPVYPGKRTSSVSVGMSRMCQQRKLALLFDHLVGAGEQVLWDFEAQRFGGMEVDHELEPGGLHDRQVRWLFAVENPCSIDANFAIGIAQMGSVARQAAR